MTEQVPQREGNAPGSTDEQIRQMAVEGGAKVPTEELEDASAAPRDDSDTGHDQ